jgi:hypothetical protein
LNSNNRLLKDQKKQNIVSIEEIVGDNNAYKKMLGEMRDMNESLKGERVRILGEKERMDREMGERVAEGVVRGKEIGD